MPLVYFSSCCFFIFVFVSTKRHETCASYNMYLIFVNKCSLNCVMHVVFHNYNIIAFDCRRCCTKTHSLIIFFLFIDFFVLLKEKISFFLLPRQSQCKMRVPTLIEILMDRFDFSPKFYFPWIFSTDFFPNFVLSDFFPILFFLIFFPDFVLSDFSRLNFTHPSLYDLSIRHERYSLPKIWIQNHF